MSQEKVAVVTGAARGIGLETARALGANGAVRVYVTARDERAGRAALAELHLPKGDFHPLDVADEDSVRTLADHLRKTHGGLDILINNAGYNNYDPFPDYEECKNIININYRGITYTAKYLFPLLRENGRVVNVSSDCGHLSNLKHPEWISRLKSESLQMVDLEAFVDWYLESVRNGTFEAAAHFQDGGRYAAYRVSKIALSAATRLWARQWAARGVAITSVHPGLVRTGMTRGAGFLSPAQAARTLVALALRTTPDYNGAYVWHDGTLVNWADHEDTRWYFKADTLQQYA